MKIKESFARKVFLRVNDILMLGLILITLYPFLYVVFASLSSPSALLGHEGFLLKPLSFSLESYKLVLTNKDIYSSYMVTIFVSTAKTLLRLVLTSVAAYFFTRKNVMHRKFFMMMIVITMYFSGGMIPTYLIMKSIGFENNMLVMIIPGCLVAQDIFVLRTAFYNVPQSLEESALLDGAGHLRLLWSVIVPLSKATLSVIALWAVVGVWNSWFEASIYIRDRWKFPLQLIMREILINNNVSQMTSNISESYNDDEALIGETIQYASMIVSTLPLLCVYPFIQKYFVTGVMIGGVKE